MIAIEQWRDIAGYEGSYQVSSLGSVRSLDRKVVDTSGSRCRSYKGKTLAPGKSKSGHLSVVLSIAGESSTYQVHTLVLEAFVGSRPGTSVDCQGCHRDGNPANNELENLRWDTRSGNEMDKVDHGRSNRGIRNRAAKLSEHEVHEIRAAIKAHESSDSIAARFNVTRGLINAIKRGSAWAWLESENV